MKKISVAIVAIAMLAMVGCSSNSASSAASSEAASSAASSTASSAAENSADSAASATTTMADGVYTAQMDDVAAEADYGWRNQLVVEYKDGKMVSATFESYDADGNKKSETTPDNYPMDPAPSEWIPQLSENILAAGNSADIDGISGATRASNDARTLLAAIETEGKPGETITVSSPADSSSDAE